MKRFFIVSLAVVYWGGALQAVETNPAPTLTLVEAHEIALKNHPQIAAANYRALAAAQVVKQTRAGFFPTAILYGTAVGADSKASRIEAGGLNNPSIFERAAGGVTASQLVTDFGRTANLTASSRFQSRAESQRAVATREQVLLNVDQNYFGALEAQAVLSVARQTLATRSVLVDQVSLLASNQLKSELDVSFARVALEEARLLVQRAQNDADAALAALSTALGYRDFQPFQPAEHSLAAAVETNDLSGLTAQALQNRPELLALRDEQDAALRLARAQRDSRLPTLAVFGAAGSSPAHDNRLPDHYAAGGIQLSLPLFAGGLYLARQQEAELRAKAASELLRGLEDEIVRDVRIAWLNLSNAEQRLQTTEQLAKHATEAYELAQARYNVGSSSIVELSQAQLELTSAQIANTNARYDVFIQAAILNFQTGENTRMNAAIYPMK